MPPWPCTHTLSNLRQTKRHVSRRRAADARAAERPRRAGQLRRLDAALPAALADVDGGVGVDGRQRELARAGHARRRVRVAAAELDAARDAAADGEQRDVGRVRDELTVIGVFCKLSGLDGWGLGDVAWAYAFLSMQVVPVTSLPVTSWFPGMGAADAVRERRATMTVVAEKCMMGSLADRGDIFFDFVRMCFILFSGTLSLLVESSELCFVK